MVKSTGEERKQWIKAIKTQLRNMPHTLRKANTGELDELRRLGIKATPTRMVFAQKHTKKKARLVVCGQFLDAFGGTSTRNLDATPLRVLIASGWQKSGVLAGLDVTAAFLHADLPKERMCIVAPPPALVLLGVVEPDEYWVVGRALCGLKEPPH